MATRFDLVLSGTRLTPARLSAFLEEFAAFFREVDREEAGGNATLDLFISTLSLNSPARIGFSARPKRRGRDLSRRVVRTCTRAIRIVEAGGERPAGVNDAALTHLQRIAQQTTSDIPTVTMEVPVDREKSTISRQTDSNVERLLHYEFSIGSIEGRLEALTIHDENRFTIYDAVSGVGVRCYFDDDDLRRVQDAVGRKVIVYGRLRRDREGRPQQIRPVRFWNPIDIPPREQLPSPEGVFAGLGDSRTYLELIRNE